MLPERYFSVAKADYHTKINNNIADPRLEERVPIALPPESATDVKIHSNDCGENRGGSRICI